MKQPIQILILFFGILMSSQALQAQHSEEGMASYYHDKFEGRSTASGEPYRKDSLTAAHPSLPFLTKVKVTNLENERSVVVRINDRGPFVKTRIIDVSRAAAEILGFVDQGLTRVRIEVIEE